MPYVLQNDMHIVLFKKIALFKSSLPIHHYFFVDLFKKEKGAKLQGKVPYVFRNGKMYKQGFKSVLLYLIVIRHFSSFITENVRPIYFI